jgi:glycosyltransferase involved in cell wall biosynthesis
MKRVLFIINRMNFRASSGHGIFMKGVVETLLEKGHCIDVICDGEPETNFLEKYGINIYTPDKKDRLAYSKHAPLYQFEDAFNFEKSANYRFGIVKAMSNHMYNLIICNDTESAFVCYQMGLHKYIKIASYVHECATINPELKSGVFKDCYYDLINKMMFWPEITTLVQTDQNKNKLLDKFSNFPLDLNITVQPYPLTDSNSQNIKDTEGILFIGRYEERKNPEAFIKVLADIKSKYGVELKANVMTRTSHVKKFEADFAAIGHTNFEIVSDVVGEEKAKIIQKSRVAFMPYKNESFGIAVLEALRYMPTVVLDKYDWHYNFKSFSNYIVANHKEVADVIWSTYNTYNLDKNKVELEFSEYQQNYELSLMSLLEGAPIANAKREPRYRLYNFLKENIGSWVSLTNDFETRNSTGYIYLTSDLEVMYANANWHQIKHTNSETFLGLPDANGNLIHTEKPAESKNNEAFSRFFD